MLGHLPCRRSGSAGVEQGGVVRIPRKEPTPFSLSERHTGGF